MSGIVGKACKEPLVKTRRDRKKAVKKEKPGTAEAAEQQETIDEEDGDIATPKYERDYGDGF